MWGMIKDRFGSEKFTIFVLCSSVISRRVSQKYCQFYTCGKTTVRGASIQLIEFVNESSTKIVQSYLYRFIYINNLTSIVRTKKVQKFLRQTTYVHTHTHTYTHTRARAYTHIEVVKKIALARTCDVIAFWLFRSWIDKKTLRKNGRQIGR